MQPTELIHTVVVRLEVTYESGDKGFGTGLLYMHEQKGENVESSLYSYFIITNKHVINGGKLLNFKVNKKDCTGEIENITYIDYLKSTLFHPDANVDLCAINISEALSPSRKTDFKLGWKFLHRDNILSTKYKEHIKAIENVLMVGYPSALMDHVNNRPLVRSGITATHPIMRYNGTKTFLIDLPVYGGSSGSPIFIAENMRIDKVGSMTYGETFFVLIGIVSQYYNGPKGENLDLGVVENFEAIQELLDLIKIEKILP